MKPILLVEDNADDVFFTRRAFKNAGILNPLVVIEDGEEAIKYLEKLEGTDDSARPLPGLVLLDLKLPLRSGLEVLRWIRSRKSEIRSVDTVAMVPALDSPDIETTARLGANTFLVKPPTAEKLMRLIQMLDLSFIEISASNTQPQSH